MECWLALGWKAGLSASTVLCIRVRTAWKGCCVFFMFGYLAREIGFLWKWWNSWYSFSVHEMTQYCPIIFVFFSQKMLFRNLSLDQFSNLGNRLPSCCVLGGVVVGGKQGPAGCYKEQEQSLLQTNRFRQGLVWYLIILQGILVYHSLSLQATVLYSILFSRTLSQFWLISMADDPVRGWNMPHTPLFTVGAFHGWAGTVRSWSTEEDRLCLPPPSPLLALSLLPKPSHEDPDDVLVMSTHTEVRILRFKSSFSHLPAVWP